MGSSLAKIGRPSKYVDTIPERVVLYTNTCVSKGILPTVEGLSRSLKVVTSTVRAWETQYDDFSFACEALRDRQREQLFQYGLTGRYNASFCIFLLKTVHGLKEEPLINATQNNIFNISPDILADAIEITRAKKLVSPNEEK